jgi:hypothetical protein
MSPKSVAAFEFRGAGAVQVWPASVEREKRISLSVPMVPPRLSFEVHAATQFPEPSVVITGYSSCPESVAAFVLRDAGVVHVWPPSVDREKMRSRSPPMVPSRLSFELHTATQVPDPSVVTTGYPSYPESVAALVFRALTGPNHVTAT